MACCSSQYDREIFRLALPALGALAAEPLYLLVDTAIVGHLGRSQLAALGIAITILGGTFAIFNFLQYGTTAQVARAGGAGENQTARRLGAQAVWLSLAFGIAVSGLIAVLAPQLVSLMGGEGQAADYAVTYLRIAAIGFPAAFLALVLDAVAIAESPKRVATAPARTNESINAVVRMKIHFPSESTRRASSSRTRASPGSSRRNTTTTNAAPIPSCAIAVPHAEPSIPQSKA